MNKALEEFQKIQTPARSSASNEITLYKCKPTEFATRHTNSTPEHLLDELKLARNAETVAKGQAGLLKTMLFARHDPPITGKAEEHGTIFTGSSSSAKLVWVVQKRFDTESFQNDHPDLYMKYCKTVGFAQLKFDKE